MHKPITLKDLAHSLGLSVSTVSRALKDHYSISEKTIKKVKDLARELDYQPNQNAIHFQQGKTFTLGVILPDLREHFFSTAISGMEEEALKHDYTILFAQSHNLGAREHGIIEKFKNQRVDGLIISIAKHQASVADFEALKQLNIPVVYFDCVPQINRIYAVLSDIEKSTVDMVTYLLEQQHRVIAMINGPAHLKASIDRQTGLMNALSGHDLKYDPSLMIHSSIDEANTILAAETLLKNKRKVTAIIAFNDYVALFLLKFLKSKGLEKQIAVVSYANLPLISYLTEKPLASIEQFPYEQGKRAIELIIKLIQEPEQLPENGLQIIIQHELVIHSES